MMTDYGSLSGTSGAHAVETPSERDARIGHEFVRRLRFIGTNFRQAHLAERECLGFNESLAVAKRMLNPNHRGEPERQRVHPLIETVINYKALKQAQQRGDPSGNISSADVNAAARETIAELKPLPGRPANIVLAMHVHAAMVLYFETCGCHLGGSYTRNSDYEPRITSKLGIMIVEMFKAGDPRVTLTAIVNIIKKAHKLGAIEGKTFLDFFPLYGQPAGPNGKAPEPPAGRRFEAVVPLRAIYSS